MYKNVAEFNLSDTTTDAMLNDELIVVNKSNKSITLKRIAYSDNQKEKVCRFITNHIDLSPDKIAYKTVARDNNLLNSR